MKKKHGKKRKYCPEWKERGTTFGYQDLVIDYRGIPEMQTFGFPVILGNHIRQDAGSSC